MRPALQVDGVDVFIEGEGAETLVMIHGWPDSYRLWDAQVAHFKAGYRCLRFTLPGFDLATPRRAVPLAQMIETIRRIVDQASPTAPVVLMVHDWGCLFGYQFALRHPARVSRLIGVDIGDAGSPAHQRELGARAKAMVLGYQLWLAFAWWVGGALGDRMTRYMARALRCPTDPRQIGVQMNYPYFIQWTGRHGSYRGARPFMPACPMLYLYGSRKPFLFHSAGWAAAVAALPGSRVVAMRAGHWVMRNDAAGFNRAVETWLAG